jgi:hypothetical protein
VVEIRNYHKEYTDVTWETCDLREYLNGEFFEFLCLSENFDVSRIAEVTNQNSNNPWFGTNGGNSTQDKIFLLSLEEVCGSLYFGDSMSRLKKQGSQEYWIYDKNSPKRVSKYEYSKDNIVPKGWWTRSPADSNCHVALVGECGDVHVDSTGVTCEYGVRPALWLKLCGGDEK